MLRSVDDPIEILVRSAVSKFGATADFEDRLQIGRLAVLKCLDQRPEIAQDVAANSDFLFTQIVRAVMRERINPTVERPRFSYNRSPAAETYVDALDAACRRRHGESFPVLRARLDERDVLSLLKSDSLRNPGCHERKAMVVWALVAIEDLPLALIAKKLNYAVFVRHALTGWLWAFFGNSPFRAINWAYPGKFLPHHMAQAPMRHWSGRGGRERAIAALREALAATGHPEDLYPKIVTERFFEEFKLTSPLQKRFGSHFAFLNAAYPKRFHPWEMAVTPPRFFENPANVVAATRWLVEQRLGIPLSTMSVREVWRGRYADAVTKEVFVTNGLSEIMATYKSPEPVMRMAYPGKFLEWSFQRKGKWEGRAGRKLAAKATRWLFDEYLGVSPLDVRITCETFRQNGLWGMLTAKSLGFRTSPLAALKNAYPELAAELRRPPVRGRTRHRIPIPTERHVMPVDIAV